MLFRLNRADSRRSLLRVSSLASFTEQWSIGPENDKIDQLNYRLLFLQYEIDPGPIMLPSKLSLKDLIGGDQEGLIRDLKGDEEATPSQFSNMELIEILLKSG